MIEAVNSVLSNAAVTSRVAEQQSAARSYAANPEKVQEVAKTPYISPYISIDRQSNKAVLQIRDSDTGDVVTQYPTEGQLKAYRQAQQASIRADRAAENAVAKTVARPSEDSTPSVTADVSVPSVDTQEASVPSVGSVDTEA